MDKHANTKRDDMFASIISGAIVLLIFALIMGFFYIVIPENVEAEPEETVGTIIDATVLTEIVEPTEPATRPVRLHTPTMYKTTRDELISQHNIEPVEETAPEEEPKLDHGFTELEMLAIVIFQEAGGGRSCDDCRRYVGDIVLNRMASSRYPDTMYEVLTQYRQYGRLYWTGIKWPDRASSEYEAKNVARAYRIAEELLSGNHSKVYGQGYVYQAEFEQGTDGFWCCGHFYGR